MDSFVKIQTLYTNANDRNIDALKAKYEDRKCLKETISSLTKDQLNEETIGGKRVLIKPNWVKHSTKDEDDLCLRTHDNFLLATLEAVLDLKPSSVTVGDAPIQGADWDKILNKVLLQEIQSLSLKYSLEINIVDFRRVTFSPSTNTVTIERKPLEEYHIFDLGKMSFLEPLSISSMNKFRVTQYNPDRFIDTHFPGVHKYCVTRELFQADVVLSIPKVKTHQKTGITNALKNVVGLNGDKDFLPHHRLGGVGRGGDCYPGKNLLRYWAELALDNANRVKGKRRYWFWERLSSMLWCLSFPGKEHHLSAAWHGNDTTWRMVMDINRIILYGCSDGTISKLPKRKIFSLCDGIIGGQGDGPLHPEPLPIGVICFSNDSAWCDISMSTLMQLDYKIIPLLMAAVALVPENSTLIELNGRPTNLAELKNYGIKTLPPPGWVEYFNKEGTQ